MASPHRQARPSAGAGACSARSGVFGRLAGARGRPRPPAPGSGNRVDGECHAPGRARGLAHVPLGGVIGQGRARRAIRPMSRQEAGPMNTRVAITVHPRTRRDPAALENPRAPARRIAAKSNAAVSFKDAPGDRGTEIHVDLERARRRQARRGRREAARRRRRWPKVKDELRRFKQHVETGEIPRSDGVARGRAGRAQAQAAPGAAARASPSSRRWVCDEGERLVGPQHGPGRERPGPEDPQRPRRDREDHARRRSAARTCTSTTATSRR